LKTWKHNLKIAASRKKYIAISKTHWYILAKKIKKALIEHYEIGC